LQILIDCKQQFWPPQWRGASYFYTGLLAASSGLNENIYVETTIFTRIIGRRAAQRRGAGGNSSRTSINAFIG
jgi:hypothetical protein